MDLQKEIYNAYRDLVKDHMEENRKGALKMKEILDHSPMNRGECVEMTLQIPKVYSEETIGTFRRITEDAYRIFEKVFYEYRNCEDYRKLFGFSPELEELILLPMQYDGFLPISRIDVFYNEETGAFKFCEVNTDGTAAMFRDPELRKALIANPAHQEIIRRYRFDTFELFDSWVKTFLELYDTYPGRKAEPNVAIVDFLDNATMPDFEEFARHFQEAGVNCEICDARSLTYRDGALYSSAGHRVDAIYRRAVTVDIMAHYGEVTDLIQCLRDDNVFMAGAFSTQIFHSKWFFYVLHHERTLQFLTKEEQEFVKAHIPVTTRFSGDYISYEEVRDNKDHYVIKPMDSYASKGVYISGREHSRKEWERRIEPLWGRDYICQEFCEQYMTENIDFAWGDGEWHLFMNMPGLYVYNGVFAGIFMRMAEGEEIIAENNNERTVPAFVIKGKK